MEAGREGRRIGRKQERRERKGEGEKKGERDKEKDEKGREEKQLRHPVDLGWALILFALDLGYAASPLETTSITELWVITESSHTHFLVCSQCPSHERRELGQHHALSATNVRV